MLLFDELTCVRIEKHNSVLHQVRVIIKRLSQIYPLLQQMSGKLISFSTIRHNVYLIHFTKCRYRLQQTITDLVVVAKHCNTILDPATYKHVDQHTQQYF